MSERPPETVQGGEDDPKGDPPAIVEPAVARPIGQAPGDPTMLRMVMEASLFRGPLPPPDMLKEYEEVCPGFSERTLAMAEKQSDHRRSIESRYADANVATERRGQWMAFSLAGMVFLIGGGAVFDHQTVVGSIIMGGNAVAIIALFCAKQVRERTNAERVTQRHKDRQEASRQASREDGSAKAEGQDGGAISDSASAVSSSS